MEEYERNELIKFYKQLTIKTLIEKKRFEIYRDEIKSINAKEDRKRFLKLKIDLENQLEFVNELMSKQKEIANLLVGFFKVYNDKECMVFANCIIRDESPEDVARLYKMKLSDVCKIKKSIEKDLDNLIVKEKI